MQHQIVVSRLGLLPIPLVLWAGSNLCFSQTNVLTYHNDHGRTGQNLTETVLNPTNVKSSTFGKLFTVQVDGKVDAQPLYVSSIDIPGQGTRSVVYAATEHDSVYGLDAHTGHIYWHKSLLESGETPSDNHGCGQVSPEIGITATPVIDLTAGLHGTIYLVATSKDALGDYHQRLHALDLTTGTEEFGGPKQIAATYPGSGDNSSNGRVVFDAKQYKSRPGLLLLNGTVYTGWGSHCDLRPYTGWIIGYDRLSLAQNSVFNFAPNGEGAAVWAAGGGIAADGAGNLFVSVSNGTFDTSLTTQGFPSKHDYGNAFVKLTRSSGQLNAADYWTMDNTVSESNHDEDLGSGGLTLLPDLTDAKGNTRHLGTGAGKDGNVYVFDRDNMGKFDSSNNSNLYQELPGELSGGEYGSPAWFNGNVYYGAAGDRIQAFKVNAALLTAHAMSTTSTAFTYPGATPAISAHGTSNAILWAVENSNPAVLHAYDATNLATELYNSNQAASGRDHFGPGNKFITPTIADGKVLVGTTNSVVGFGLLKKGPIADGNHVIANEASSLVLDDPAFSTKSGQQINQWTPNGGTNQEWRFAFQQSGYYTIQNVSSGLFLTDPGGTSTLGAELQQQAATNSSSQLWQLIASGSYYVIVNPAGNLVIDDPAFSTNPGTGIQLWTRNGGSNQNWSIH
jgi:Ricin-type beta-trefoil lectin domain-like